MTRAAVGGDWVRAIHLPGPSPNHAAKVPGSDHTGFESEGRGGDRRGQMKRHRAPPHGGDTEPPLWEDGKPGLSLRPCCRLHQHCPPPRGTRGAWGGCPRSTGWPGRANAAAAAWARRRRAGAQEAAREPGTEMCTGGPFVPLPCVNWKKGRGCGRGVCKTCFHLVSIPFYALVRPEKTPSERKIHWKL